MSRSSAMDRPEPDRRNSQSKVAGGEASGGGPAALPWAPPPPGSSWVNGAASPLYNMGLADVRQKSIHAHAVTVDKLRLNGWVTGLEPDDVAYPWLGGLDGFRSSRGRNRGRQAVYSHTGWWKPRCGGSPVLVRYDESGGDGKLIAEFNPAKLAAESLAAIGEAWRHLTGQSILRAFVHRYDVAIDYPVHRALLVLDDSSGRRCSADGASPWGWETVRTGYRKGSPLKVQLYDKCGEAASRGVDLGGPVTRLEFQKWVPPLPVAELRRVGSDLTLADLDGEPYPDRRVTVRRFEWDPATIADPLMRLAAMACMAGEVCKARQSYKQLMSADRLDQFQRCVVPEVEPRPAELFGRHWPAAVRSVQRLLAGEGGSDAVSA